jgi:hypothetical protein
MDRTLFTPAEVADMISAGDILLLAGEEALFAQLPRGNWIGGTIPYFMTAEHGGVKDSEHLFVTRFPRGASVFDQALFDEEALPGFAEDGPDSGCTLILLPAFSAVHSAYAQNVASWNDAFVRPVAGWVAGVPVEDIGARSPKVFDGRTGRGSSDEAVVMHLALPEAHYADIDIVNLFTQGDGDTICFDAVGFSAGEAIINGERQNLASYITDRAIDTRLPLVADYCGAMINVSLAKVDADCGKVDFYAPVFAGVEYRFAAPVADYSDSFEQRVHGVTLEPNFSCNCVLNYLYADLVGKRTDSLVGPMTFGEISYMLLNQTLVHLSIADHGSARLAA